MRRFLPWLFTILLVVSATDCRAKDVILSWDRSPTISVTGYIVVMSMSPDMQNPLPSLDVGNVLTRTILDLEDTYEHWFCVKAYDGLGNKSVCSNIVHSPAIVDSLPVLDLNISIEVIK